MDCLALNMFEKISFNQLKAHHQVSLELENKQAPMLLTADIQSYDLPGLNIKIPETTEQKNNWQGNQPRCTGISVEQPGHQFLHK